MPFLYLSIHWLSAITMKIIKWCLYRKLEKRKINTKEYSKIVIIKLRDLPVGTSPLDKAIIIKWYNVDSKISIIKMKFLKPNELFFILYICTWWNKNHIIPGKFILFSKEVVIMQYRENWFRSKIYTLNEQHKKYSSIAMLKEKEANN
jgi:hypothetical protein